MSQYMAAIWKCRYFWLSLVQMDLRSRYRRSLLGLGWSLLHPIAMTAVLCLVFPRIFLKVDVRTYAPMVLVGLCFWSFVTSTTLLGSQCLFQGERYIRQFPAPMAIYPLRIVLGSSFHFAMALLVVLVLRLGLIATAGTTATENGNVQSGEVAITDESSDNTTTTTGSESNQGRAIPASETGTAQSTLRSSNGNRMTGAFSLTEISRSNTAVDTTETNQQKSSVSVSTHETSGFSGMLSIVSLIPTFILMFILGWSLAVLSGFVTAYFPDMQHLAEVGLQILFYATPIIYPADTIKGNLGRMIDCNPLTSFIGLLRSPLLNGEFPALSQYAAAVISTAIIAGAATFTLVRLQKKIIFQL